MFQSDAEESATCCFQKMSFQKTHAVCTVTKMNQGAATRGVRRSGSKAFSVAMSHAGAKRTAGTNPLARIATPSNAPAIQPMLGRSSYKASKKRR